MVVDVFPSTSEIIEESSAMSICEMCGKQFQNTSACRLHRLKTHKIVNDEKLSDRRLDNRLDGEAITYAYHCPHSVCSTKESVYDGMKSLRQHYFRTHSEKRFACQCGFSSGLEKDLKYHRKSRCRLRSDEEKSRKRKAPSSESPMPLDIHHPMPSVPAPTPAPPPTTTVVHPIFLIVPANDVQSVIDNINQSLGATNSSADIAIQTLPQSQPLPPQPQPQNHVIPPQMMIAASQQTTNAPYYDRAANEMDHQMGYYDPGPFNYQNNDGYRHQGEGPQTRSFGTTMLNDVSTRHMGTSMEQEDYISMLIRDTETQTTSQHPWEWPN